MKTYLELLNHLPNPMWRAGLDGKCNYFNRAWLEFTGRALEEELRNGWASSIHPEDLDASLLTFSDAFRARRSFTMEYRLRRKDGTYGWLLDSARPFDDEKGEFAGYIGSCYDITERKIAENALKKSEEKYRRLIELAQEGIWFFDEDMNTVFVNARMADMLGLPIPEIMGKPIFDFIDAENQEPMRAHIERRKRGMSERYEFEFIRHGGDRLYVSISASPIHDENGHFLGSLTMFSDLTERKRMEKEKENIQGQLFHASKLASIGTLAAGVAHEINNPLTVIQGNISILREKLELIEAARDCAKYLDRQQSATSRIADIVSGLRTYARADMEVLSVDMHQVISDVLSLSGFIYKKAGIEIRTRMLSQKRFVNGNPGKLQQVLMNLLSNSKDALEQRGFQQGGENRIEIETSDFEDRIVLKVRDNGCGIAQEFLERIFDPFYTTKPVGKGTGLGLSITHSIVNSMGGTIQVRSTQNLETEVTLSLPAVAKSAESEEKGLAKSKRPGLSRFAQKTGRVLVVDDEDEIRNVLRSYLESFGFQVSDAPDGEVALEMLKIETFDYVITDLKMPRMTGDVLVSRGKLLAPSKTRFIVVTGGLLSDCSPEQRELLNRADKLIMKPFDRAALYSALD